MLFETVETKKKFIAFYLLEIASSRYRYRIGAETMVELISCMINTKWCDIYIGNEKVYGVE